MKPATKQILWGLFLALVGLAWVALIQFGIEMTGTSLTSNFMDQVDMQRTDFQGYEIRNMLGRFAREYKKAISPVWLPAIPLAIGFFLLGSGWRTWRQRLAEKR
jgi:hypothetical protein